MEDIVGIKVVDKKKGAVAFLTWGRVFDRVDPGPLEKAVGMALSGFGFKNVKSVKVCHSLQDVADYTYFHEGLVAMSWKPIPFGKKTYKSWIIRMRRAIPQGKEIYYLGGTVKTPPRRANVRC